MVSYFSEVMDAYEIKTGKDWCYIILSNCLIDMPLVQSGQWTRTSHPGRQQWSHFRTLKDGKTNGVNRPIEFTRHNWSGDFKATTYRSSRWNLTYINETYTFFTTLGPWACCFGHLFGTVHMSATQQSHIRWTLHYIGATCASLLNHSHTSPWLAKLNHKKKETILSKYNLNRVILASFPLWLLYSLGSAVFASIYSVFEPAPTLLSPSAACASEAVYPTPAPTRPPTSLPFQCYAYIHRIKI